MAGGALRDAAIADVPQWRGIRLPYDIPVGNHTRRQPPAPLREVAVPLPAFGPDGLTFPRHDIGFLDGVVDLDRWIRAARHIPWTLNVVSAAGIPLSDRLSLRVTAAFTGRRLFADTQKGVLLGALNHSLRKIITNRWDFNGVGDRAAPDREAGENQRR